MKLFKYSLIATAMLTLVACDGDDGVNGSDGADGIDGNDGLNSLVLQTRLDVGDSNCPNGGVQIDSGQDDNNDGELQDAEIDASEYVCSPGNTEVAASQLRTSLDNSWFQRASQQVSANKETWISATQVASPKGAAAMGPGQGKAKNVILFVGDGMGISTITAARILEGQMQGKAGEEHQLSFERFPFAGLSKTYNVDAQTPDSAGTMTAMMSGVKTDVGVIGVDADIERGDCSTVAGNELVTALELAELAGKSTGIVSTARITHATPAATYAKSADRNWEDISDMPQGTECLDIAYQLVNFEPLLEQRFPAYADTINGIEVAFGGGRRHFLPKDAAFNSADAASEVEGDRTDNLDLTQLWQDAYAGGIYVEDQAGFDAIPASAERVFGLFNESHMQYEADRGNDIAGEPSITEMTSKAIDILAQNENGFFLMVESGRIDHAHHAGNAYGALQDTIAFADAIQAAVDMTDPQETLILVTADHGHVFTIAGYPKRGNPILGKVVNVGAEEPALAADGMPYTTLGYANGLGYRNLADVTNSDASYVTNNGQPDTGRKDLTDVDTTTAGYHQEALIPLSSETHSGEDVSIHASGPGAWLANGTHEQSMIFHLMNYAADLVQKAEENAVSMAAIND